MSQSKDVEESRASWRLRTYPLVILVALVGALLLATSGTTVTIPPAVLVVTTPPSLERGPLF